MHVKNSNQDGEKVRLGSFKNVFRNKEVSLWHRAEDHVNNADTLYDMAHGKFSLMMFHPRSKDLLLESSSLYHAAAIDFIASGHWLRAAQSFERSADILLEHCNNEAAKLSRRLPFSRHGLLIFDLRDQSSASAKGSGPYSTDLHLAARDYLSASMLYGQGHRRGRERAKAAARKILLNLGFNENDMAKESSQIEGFVSRESALTR